MVSEAGRMRARIGAAKARRKRAKAAGGNLVDRLVSYFDPISGAKRARARHALALAGRLEGGSTRRPGLEGWRPRGGSPDDDLLDPLDLARDRSRDLGYNSPIASGAIAANIDGVIGVGLVPKPRIDRKLLGLSDQQADDIERSLQKRYHLWADSPECDLGRTATFIRLQIQALAGTLLGGDIFALPIRLSRAGSPYDLKVQLIEAERCRNKDNVADTDRLKAGIEHDENGAPLRYQFARDYPGTRRPTNQWDVREAFDAASGDRRVFHVFDQQRPGQRRGVPVLAPVVGALKQLDRGTEAELYATVLNAIFAVTMTSEDGTGSDGLPSRDAEDLLPERRDLEPGLILDLAEGDKVESFTPGRPNASFEPFYNAIAREIAIGLNLPVEVVLRQFKASYSASRAAIELAWLTFKCRRAWFVPSFCAPFYQAIATEAIARGEVSAPGFLRGDPLVRAAYLHAEWTGPTKPQIDEVKETQAALARIEGGISTFDRETALITGEDWESTVGQQGKERRRRIKEGLVAGDGQAAARSPAPDDPADDSLDDEETGDEELEDDELGGDDLEDEELEEARGP